MRHRSAAVVAALGLVGVLTTACASTPETGADARPSIPAPPAPTAPTVPDGPVVGEQTVTCRHLLDSGWQAAPTDADVSWDPATGRAEFRFGAAEPVVVDVHDPDCAQVPDLSRMVASMLEDHETNRRSECADAVRRLFEDAPPVKGEGTGREITGSLPAVRAYVLAECPPAYAQQLVDAGR